MPDLRSGEYVWKKGEIRPEDKPAHIKAENKPGHKPITEYKLPQWVFHPELPAKWDKVFREDYAGAGIGGHGNREGWTVAHVAAYHDDPKLYLLATPEELRTPTKFGHTPAHFACVGGCYTKPSLWVLASLVEAGVDMEAKNCYGRTPLQDAKWFLHPDDIKQVEKVLGGWKPDSYAATLELAKQKRPKYGGKSPEVKKLIPESPVIETVPIGLIFPGQGSQYVKMLSDDQDNPVVKQMLKTAKEILGYDLLDICLNGPEDKLEQTKYCQPAMYVAGCAAMAKLRDSDQDKVDKCQAVAGLSLGEYTALTAAGVFTFAEGLKLVKLRGEAMQEAAEMGTKQGMISVAGLDEKALNDIINKVKTGDEVLQIANFLFPKGFSVAGNMSAVERLEPAAKQAGALQAKVLKTSGAFHTSLMKPAQEKLVKALEAALPNMKPPRCTVYMNTTGKPIPPGAEPKEIIKLLGDQLTSCVLWEPGMKAMIGDGVQEFYECGPMKQLKAMMKRIDNNMWSKTSNVPV